MFGDLWSLMEFHHCDLFVRLHLLDQEIRKSANRS